MKKSVLILIGFLIMSFNKEKRQDFIPRDQQKLLTVSAEIGQWNQIIDIIDLSVADPKERVAAKNFIVNQLQNQLKQQLPKPPIDTSKTKK